MCVSEWHIARRQGPHSVTLRHFAPSRVERAGGECLGTRLQLYHCLRAVLLLNEAKCVVDLQVSSLCS